MSMHDLLAGMPRDTSFRGRRVLVVEDNFLIAQDLLEELLRCGAQVMGPVACVADALNLLQSSPPPYMAILDIRLGDELVYPVADALRSLGVPFIFATGCDPSAVPAIYANVILAEKPLALRGSLLARG